MALGVAPSEAMKDGRLAFGMFGALFYGAPLALLGIASLHREANR